MKDAKKGNVMCSLVTLFFLPKSKWFAKWALFWILFDLFDHELIYHQENSDEFLCIPKLNVEIDCLFCFISISILTDSLLPQPPPLEDRRKHGHMCTNNTNVKRNEAEIVFELTWFQMTIASALSMCHEMWNDVKPDLWGTGRKIYIGSCLWANRQFSEEVIFSKRKSW